MFELGFCSEPDSRSLAEQYEGIGDGDEDTTTTVYYSATLYILLLIITATLQSSLYIIWSACTELLLIQLHTCYAYES